MKKILFSMLALLLAMGGAWAQGPTQVTQFTTDQLPATWASDNSNLTLADLQALGFEAVDASVAQAWTGAPQGGFVVLIYGFDDWTYFNYIMFYDGHVTTPSHTRFSKRGLYEGVASNIKHFYTGSPEPAEIELTKAGANQWTLGQTPDYDLELQVEYYQPHALKDIPAGWTVLVNGVDKTAAIAGDSLMIVETDSVTLVPPADVKPNVKSVTLAEPLLNINIDGHKIYYLPGETWEQAIMNHPENTGWYISGNKVFLNGVGILGYDDYPYNDVGSGDEINPNRSCYLGN